MSDNEKLLRELCEVCPEWKPCQHTSGVIRTLPRTEIHVFILLDEGEIDEQESGAALWSMLREMRERWNLLLDNPDVSKNRAAEFDGLWYACATQGHRLGASQVLESYIAWKRSQKEPAP